MKALMPALFIGHGSPMNAIEDNTYSQGWRALAQHLPQPKAVLCISAHWETHGTFVTASAQPETIHDFYGFPQPLFDVRYHAPGNPALAQRVATLTGAQLDPAYGLDHGSWSVLCQMYPEATVPVLQLSLDRSATPQAHYALAQKLSSLRDEGVLILGSGDIVHNLRVMDWHHHGGFDWAARINETVKQKILAQDHAALSDYRKLDPEIALAIPSPEHYLPLLYPLAVQRAEEAVSFFNDEIVMGSISMTCVVIGKLGR